MRLNGGRRCRTLLAKVFTDSDSGLVVGVGVPRGSWAVGLVDVQRRSRLAADGAK